jgi:hypothetical protein
MNAEMSESEARHIFTLKYALCKVFGKDVRAECLKAGVPPAMLDKIMEREKQLDGFLDLHDIDGNLTEKDQSEKRKA